MRREFARDIHMRAHRQRMYACVGAPGGNELRRLTSHPPKRFLERLLDRRPMLLPLPPHERPAVIFDREPPAGHGRTVPLEMGKPRNSSSSEIVPRPARCTVTG